MLTEAQTTRRGLLKLMLRMPQMRKRLQELCATDESLISLCCAFEDATTTLDHLRRDCSQSASHHDMLAEYEQMCLDIEKEISSICSRKA